MRDVNPKTKTVVKGQSEQRVLCGPHCYFIYFSSIVGADPKAEEAKVSVTDWASGKLVAATAASYLYGMDAKGRATIKAFADKDAATKEQQSSGGNVVSWEVLRSKELATRCAFCDRAVYPEDACGVKFGTTHGYGCCTHCSMGVAARLKQDIEVEAKDGQTGEPIRVKTLDGQIASLEPATRHCVVWAEEGPGWEVGFRRLLQAGIFRERSQPAEVAGGASGDDGAADHHCAGAGGQDEAFAGADRQGVQAGGVQVRRVR